EIAIERVRGGAVEGRIDTLIRPDDGAFGNAHIHGIAEGDLASAPHFAAVAARVGELLDGAIPVAHGAAMDEAFRALEPARARAGDDVATLRALFARVVALLAPATPRDLLQVRIGEGTARDLVLARAEEAARSGAPVRVTYRPPRRQAEELVMVVTEVRAKLDP